MADQMIPESSDQDPSSNRDQSMEILNFSSSDIEFSNDQESSSENPMPNLLDVLKSPASKLLDTYLQLK